MPSANRWGDLWRRLRRDEGSSALEFITAGVLLLVPLVYLVLAVSTIQSASLASEGAARQAARVYSLASATDEARGRALSAVDVGLDDFGFDRGDADVSIGCSPDADACLSPGSRVDVTVTVRAGLPLIPDALAPGGRAAVTVSGHASQQISRLGGAR